MIPELMTPGTRRVERWGPAGSRMLMLRLYACSTLTSESLNSRVLQYRKLYGRTFQNFEGVDYWYAVLFVVPDLYTPS